MEEIVFRAWVERERIMVSCVKRMYSGSLISCVSVL